MSLATALTALDTQRDNLATNLTTMGVTASNTETLAQLVPKVLNIESGGGGGGEELIALIGRTITGISNSDATTIGSYAFANCFNLTTVSFPVCSTIGSSAFYSCTNLTTVSFPVCSRICSYAFASCSALSTVSFPACSRIDDNAFRICTSLTTASFPAFPVIYSSVFYRCNRLISLYLLGSSAATLGNSNAFNSTPIGGYSAVAGQYGSIFVPMSLLATYQSKTNWTYFSSRFVGV